MADTEPGNRLFLRIPTGNGTVAARADEANTGSATLSSAGFTDPGQWSGGQYQLSFLGGEYSVTDSGGAVVASGTYVAGDRIEFSGFQITVRGEPADGDGFSIGQAPTRDIFATLDALEAAIRTPDIPAPNKALLQNRFYAAIEDLSRASEHFIDMRAAGGARLAQLDRSADEREAQLISARTTLSSIRDLDYAEAIGRLSQEMATLEAAQLSYQRIQSLSLFSMLR